MSASRKGKVLWPQLYEELTDAEYLGRRLHSGTTQKQLAKEIGCSEKTLRKALVDHGIVAPLYLVPTKKETTASS